MSHAQEIFAWCNAQTVGLLATAQNPQNNERYKYEPWFFARFTRFSPLKALEILLKPEALTRFCLGRVVEVA